MCTKSTKGQHIILQPANHGCNMDFV